MVAVTRAGPGRRPRLASRVANPSIRCMLNTNVRLAGPRAGNRQLGSATGKGRAVGQRERVGGGPWV